MDKKEFEDLLRMDKFSEQVRKKRTNHQLPPEIERLDEFTRQMWGKLAKETEGRPGSEYTHRYARIQAGNPLPIDQKKEDGNNE